MSLLLDALIAQRKQSAISYQEYLAKLVELTRQAKDGPKAAAYPSAAAAYVPRRRIIGLLRYRALSSNASRRRLQASVGGGQCSM